MLNKKENLIETLRGGKPDRFVNQFEALEFIFATPYNRKGRPTMPGQQTVNQWGVTIRWQEGTPGPFPVHDEEHIVLKDVTEWRTQVKIPSLDFPQEEWDACRELASRIDRKEKLATALLAPGVFDMLHYLMGMEGCLVSFYTEPDALKELIAAITDWELKYARLICDNFEPEAVFHHDDWGSHNSTFLSPEMFREFIKPSYEKIYGYYKSRGVKYVFHHSDSYAATLVPDMIDVGIDVWQGCVDTNNIPELIKKYGGSISFMGGINNGKVDVPNWSPEFIAKYVEDTCRACGTKYYIPCMTAGGPKSNYDGVYETVSGEIDRMSREMF
jgi:uroporphyrinogen-III decarboxylase